MKKKELISESCPPPIGPYSEGVRAGDLIFTGQIGSLPDGDLISEDPGEQMEQCLRNVYEIIRTEGLEMDDVIKCTVYLTDMDYFEKINDVYKTFFNKPYPARVCIQVVRLPDNAKVEVDAIAYAG